MALTDDERDRLAGQLESVSHGARRQQRATHLLLGLLVVSAVAFGIAGVVVDSDAFWAAAGSAFITASVGLTAYAGSRLSGFGQMIDLIRLSLGQAPSHLSGTESANDDAERELHQRVKAAMAQISQEASEEGSKARLAGKRGSRGRAGGDPTPERPDNVGSSK